MDAEQCDTFDPMSVPTIVELIRDLDAGQGTRLDPYVEQLQRFVQELWRVHPQEASSDPMDF